MCRLIVAAVLAVALLAAGEATTQEIGENQGRGTDPTSEALAKAYGTSEAESMLHGRHSPDPQINAAVEETIVERAEANRRAAKAPTVFTDDFVGKQAREAWKAAKRGDPLAQVYLATSYWRGVGVSQNHCKALSWFKRAARQGMGEAQAAVVMLTLSRMCERGDGRHLVRAYAWFTNEAVIALTKNGREFLSDLGADELGITTITGLRNYLRDQLSPRQVELALNLREKLLGEK